MYNKFLTTLYYDSIDILINIYHIENHKIIEQIVRDERRLHKNYDTHSRDPRPIIIYSILSVILSDKRDLGKVVESGKGSRIVSSDED